ncbi:MAG: APC family permease [Planctomycetaceae bacterium]|nr:APC family permease [Planctomycetaceae bacterium]
MSTDNPKAVSTRDLKRVLGFKELMSTSVGQIIGAGIMSLMGIAIGMTGRSVPVAFLIAAFFSVISIIPLVIIAGTVRMRGGQYTMTALLAGKRFAGVFIILFIAMNVGISMYALSFADYFLALFLPSVGRKTVAIAILIIFYLINMFGVDKMAKAQNLIVVVMVVALGLLAVFGIGKVDPDYLSGNLLPNGYKGLFSAAALLTFATGGAFLIVNLSAEAKNPTRDIPLTIVVSTLGVAVLYGFIAVVAAGVLPVETVAFKPLSLVAEAVFPPYLYVFFMVCGAMFALISTLNAQLAWATKLILQACVDGWFPQ